MSDERKGLPTVSVFGKYINFIEMSLLGKHQSFLKPLEVNVDLSPKMNHLEM
jgi:hypothetical protein